ncbi:MAG: Maf family protein [Chloroflexi bacterium]|nr:Maf family protein [Chloroflexota bacterium]
MIPNLVLASNSPRRRELLSLGGQDYRVVPADVDETPRGGEDPKDYVLRLAQEKARVAATVITDQDALILAADTTVVHEGHILGKPANAEEAKDMLNELRRKTHWVVTAIALLRTRDQSMHTDLAQTEVPMRNYSDAEIAAYVDSEDPLDKAGAYAIQHAGFHPVAFMQGCYANVIGLPLCHLQRSLQKWGLSFDKDLSPACQAHLSYDCPVTSQILAW